MFAREDAKQQRVNKQCNMEKVPKTTYVSRKILEIAVNSAVIEFNDGNMGI